MAEMGQLPRRARRSNVPYSRSHPKGADVPPGGEGRAQWCPVTLKSALLFPNKCTHLHPIQVLPLTEEELTLRAAGASRTDPRWLSPKRGTGSMGAGRALGWSPSSAATMPGTERARSFLPGHPLPLLTVSGELRRQVPGGHHPHSDALGMSCQGVIQSSVTPGPGSSSVSPVSPPPAPPPGAPVQPPAAFCRAVARLQSPIHAPHTSQAPRGWPRTAGVEPGGAGGCGHQRIRRPRRLALGHPCREGQCPAAFLSAGPDPGSCRAWKLHLLRHWPERMRAAVRTDGSPCPTPPT